MATFTTASLAVGTDTVTASYGGTADFAPSTTGTIVTAAGNGTAGYSGDNGPATAAELNDPYGVAVDAAGDLFIADTDNNVIREVVKATGDIITVAGNGTAGYSGDNGPATAAELNHPDGVAVDAAGDLFIADADNNVIREVVKATGDIITVAGNGTAGYSGDNGPATAAELNYPNGVAVDAAGDLFIADTGNNVIREVVKATGDIITVAGNGTAGYSGDNGPATAAELNYPTGVAVDAAGDLFIADTGNNVIREVVKATGDIITVAGNGTAGYSGDNGPATAAELNCPDGVAVDAAGDLFIADTDNSVIREVVKATGDIITVAGNGTAGYSGDNGPATAAELDDPDGVAVDAAGDLFIADSDNNVIREVVKATGDIITVAGNGTAGYSGDNGPATAAELNHPDGVAVDAAGDLFIADTGNNVIREVVKATGDIITVAGNGTVRLQRRQRTRDRRRAELPRRRRRRRRGRPVHRRHEQQRDPRGRQGDRRHHHRRRQRHPRLQRRQRTRDRRRAGRPHGVAVDAAGDLFIADSSNNVIREVVKATGDIITVAGNGTPVTAAITGPRPPPSWTAPLVSPSTPRATCSSPTRTTT